jgi:hypothetical protein
MTRMTASYTPHAQDGSSHSQHRHFNKITHRMDVGYSLRESFRAITPTAWERATIHAFVASRQPFGSRVTHPDKDAPRYPIGTRHRQVETARGSRRGCTDGVPERAAEARVARHGVTRTDGLRVVSALSGSIDGLGGASEKAAIRSSQPGADQSSSARRL